MNLDAIALRRRFEDAGQGHVFAFEKQLSEAESVALHEHAARIDLALVSEMTKLTSQPASMAGDTKLGPPEVFPLVRSGAQEARAREARARGAEILRESRVGFVLVAGGQASRLGYDGPKGMFPVGPVTNRTLFEIFARRLQAARLQHGTRPTWYVLTSESNHGATRAYFERERFFGLDPEDVFFFRQAMVPALDMAGKILMAEKHAPFLAPNGHGGVLAALAASGALVHARARGIDHLSYFQVDNPLAQPADALFLGLHALEGAEMSSKIVKKRDAAEKVGVLGRVDGALSCIEYSDLPAALREARNEQDELVWSAGNIALHVMDVAFVEALTRGRLQLPWHVAKKRIPSLDSHGKLVQAEGFKFEAFVFDALARTSRSVVLEVDRAHEFSPVKNSSGEDSPASARRDLCRLWSGWARAAGLELPPADAQGNHPVEVDPCRAEDEAAFCAQKPKPTLHQEGHFYT